LAKHDDMLTSRPSTSECLLRPEAVRVQLARIVQSRTFSNAPTLRRLLDHLVERSLQGSADRLKEYVLGLEVFDRGESFDPRIDTIVRVQARMLRRKLKEYYGAEGLVDPIVIELPKGHYVVMFRSASLTAHDSRLHFVQTHEADRDRIEGAPSQMTSSRTASLPVPRTTLIGREQELASVKKLLTSGNARLITLTGTGGSGKTRLGLQAASEVLDEFPGGVYFVALASTTDPTTVTPTVAQVLGIRHTGGKPLAEALQDHLRLLVDAPTLILLDNFEHLLTAAALVGELLEACAPLKVLVTSRAALHVYGEYECPVPPLPLPEPEQFSSLEALSRNPAVSLFVERATSVKAEFVLTEDNATVVAQICCRVDGLPLAIELAAARIKMLAPAAMLARLQSRLELLTNGPADRPLRQQTLRRTIDWSHDLLSPAEQKLFRRLSVFVGGCTLEGAEAVCDTRRDLEIDLLEGMASLVDKSLVQQVQLKDDEARFTMLETVREYGLERLKVSGEDESTRRAHAAYCLVLAEEGNPQLTTSERTEWLIRCEVEHDNFRAALDWLIGRGDAEWSFRLGLALFGFWERREHLAEGRQRLEALLSLKSAAARTKPRAKIARHLADLANNQGDYETALRLHGDALQIFRELDEQKGIASQLNALGTTKRFQGDYAAARFWFEQCLDACRKLGGRTEIAAAMSNLADIVGAQGDYFFAGSLLEEARLIFRELGDSTGVAWCLNHLGDVARNRGEFTEARRFYQEGMDAFCRLGDRWGIARSCADLGNLACDERDHATAHSLFERALKTFLELGHKRGIAKVLEGFACLSVHQGSFESALTLAGAATALRRVIGAAARCPEQAKLDRMLEPAWQHGPPSVSKAAWDAGSRMRLEEAIEYAAEPAGIKPGAVYW
jgi:predicted ATPase